MISLLDLSPLEPLLDGIRNTYINNGVGMRYGWKSNPRKEYDYGHWHDMILPNSKAIGYDHNELPYIQDHPMIQQLWDEIQNQIGDRVLVRAYVNGYTFGTDAYYHQDDLWIKDEFGADSVSETILIYMNEEDWDPDWGGETSFIDEDNEFIGASFPKRNRAVIFDSDIMHSARSLSRSCPHFRSILVFKTAGPEYNRPFVKWIKDRTQHIPHSGITMFEHLYGTAMTIGSMSGVPHHIVRAGLFHSVYDTEYFKAGLDVTREEIQELIGKDAEELVHLFCTTKDRYNAFINNTGNWNAETRFGLLLIELANTLEQAPRQQPNPIRNERIAKLDEEINKYERKYEE